VGAAFASFIQMEPVYRPIAVTAKSLLRLMGWRLLVTNGDVVPREGAAVVACNHVSYLDPIMLGLALERHGRLPRFLAKRELFQTRVLGPMLRQMRHVPVDRRGVPGVSLPAAVERLRQGDIVAVFPESTIHVRVDPASGKTGAARLATEAGVPLLPVGLWGGQAIASKGEPLRASRGAPLSVHFGEPLTAEPDEDPRALTWRLMLRIGELADAAEREVAGARGA
jgi:1-acyl-sn-glycerol-3-phosphate acyltransferase